MRPHISWMSLPCFPDFHTFYRGELGLRIVSMGWSPFTAISQDPHSPQRGRQSIGPYGVKASHWAIRELLSQQVQGRIPPERWTLKQSSLGKPEVAGPEPGYHVSIAYAGDIGAVAVTKHRPVGIDLERLPCRLDDDLPAYLLSRHEIMLLHDNPGMFVTIWTLKEALAKEIGEGLMGDTAAIDTAAYVLAPAGTLKDRPDGGAVFHDCFHLGDSDYALALTLGPPRR